MSATKTTKPATPAKTPAVKSAPVPTTAQAAFLGSLTRGRVARAYITPKGQRKAAITTASGRAVEGVESPRRAMLDSCVNKGWLAKIGGDESSTLFGLADAGRAAMKAAAKAAKAAAGARSGLI